ncbi:hypothetical protein ACEN9H_32060 (plasmid) [Massilia cellulosiltytica]|uniref:hypothetical protein n=1 Tax=Massilia cellulosiltytica TaxID=2683234 RepID=UPI0039B6AFCB
MSRANPLDGLNLEEFQPKAPEPKARADREEIGRIAKENGFPSRQAPIDKPAEERPRQHYFRTGRNKQINIKGSLECDEHLQRLVAELDVPKGVVLEEALKALEAVKSSTELTERLDREFPSRRKQG